MNSIEKSKMKVSLTAEISDLTKEIKKVDLDLWSLQQRLEAKQRELKRICDEESGT